MVRLLLGAELRLHRDRLIAKHCRCDLVAKSRSLTIPVLLINLRHLNTCSRYRAQALHSRRNADGIEPSCEVNLLIDGHCGRDRPVPNLRLPIGSLRQQTSHTATISLMTVPVQGQPQALREGCRDARKARWRARALLAVLRSPLHDPSFNQLHAGARGERPSLPAVLDKGHRKVSGPHPSSCHGYLGRWLLAIMHWSK